MARQPTHLLSGTFISLLLTAGTAGAASAAWLEPELLGIRGGTNAATIHQEFEYQELALRFRLPWQAERWGWTISGHLNIGGGTLWAGGRKGELYTFGPSVAFGSGRWLVDLGTAPGLLNQDDMNGRQFGGRLQFTSHIGLYFAAGERWAIGYRFQHTSNASIYEFNDGLDLQLIDLWLRF
jgi:hypothetical protein